MSEKLKECFKEGLKGERHKGLKKIAVNTDRVKGHLDKLFITLKL